MDTGKAAAPVLSASDWVKAIVGRRTAPESAIAVAALRVRGPMTMSLSGSALV